jgi:putative phosphoesterase
MSIQEALAVISDIHGNSWALAAVLKDIQSRQLKNVINLGDSLYGPLDPAGTAALLLEHNIISIRGNQDRIILEQTAEASVTLDYVRSSLKNEHLRWLEQLPFSLLWQDEIFCCHGTPKNDAEYLLENIGNGHVVMKSDAELCMSLDGVDFKLLLCGHSHLAHIVYFNDKLIFNPGSIGLPAYTDDLPEYHEMESFNPFAKYGILKKKDNKWQAELVVIPYDWHTASRVAEKNHRTDWAAWLKNGRAVK